MIPNNIKGRFQDRDYRLPGDYLITIVTKNRQQLLSQIINGEVVLSSIGKLVEKEWLRTPIIREFMNVSVGEYVIMPDHFHGILMLGQNQFNSGEDYVKQTNSFGPQRTNLGSIIRGLKGSITTQSREIGFYETLWNRRYNERWLINKEDLKNAIYYIRNNPEKWMKDKRGLSLP